MMIRTRRAIGWLACSACLGALVAGSTAPAEAQSISLGGGVASFTGGDFAGLPAGGTVGGAIHLPLDLPIDEETEATYGIDYSRYGAHGLRGATTQLDYWAGIRRTVVTGVPELRFGVRMGYSTRSLSVVEEPARTDGFLIGPGVALRVPTPLGASLELSMDVLYHTYEELLMFASREYGTDQDGFRVVMRLGLVMPFMASEAEEPRRR